MKTRLPLALALALAAAGAGAQEIPDIPFTRYVLQNGLTLVVHEDHKAPIVAVNVWYHVGSKNERPGRTGFAHLFEHLMFNGSEHFNDDYFKVLERLGATDLNGTTSEDRTNYFQNVPVSALDTVLWMESDRMGHLLGAVDQAKLDEQRGVVQNERRQRVDNQPYGLAEENILSRLYPAGHPYSWSVIGSMDDLGLRMGGCINGALNAGVRYMLRKQDDFNGTLGEDGTVGVKTVAELVAKAKAEKMSYASGGPGVPGQDIHPGAAVEEIEHHLRCHLFRKGGNPFFTDPMVTGKGEDHLFRQIRLHVAADGGDATTELFDPS